MNALLVTYVELEAAMDTVLTAGLDRVFSRADIWTASVSLAERGMSIGEIRVALDDAAARATSLPGVVLDLTACVL